MNDINLETTPIKVALHTAFYRWATKWVEGKTVLDAGCGEGFGTAYLANIAEQVIGIDNEPQWIARANILYQLDNIEFLNMDCQAMSLKSGSFDVIVSNALLEYLDNVEIFMEEIYRILRPNGLFICGTKNRELSLRNSDMQLLYRNHLQEYTPSELRSLLAEYFVDVDLYGQRTRKRSEAYILNGNALRLEGVLVKLGVKHKLPRNWRILARKLMTGVDVADLNEDDFEIDQTRIDSSFYIIGCGYKQ